jgi:hypothetical protein
VGHDDRRGERVIALWRRAYGESPLHLLAQLAGFAVAVYAFSQILRPASTQVVSLLLWFVGGALLHDLVFVPIYLVLDLVARLGLQDHALRRVRAINHVRFPLAMSFVMFLTCFPLILSRAPNNYVRAGAQQPADYLGRWLAITAVLFVASALIYAIRLRLDARQQARHEPALTS